MAKKKRRRARAQRPQASTAASTLPASSPEQSNGANQAEKVPARSKRLSRRQQQRQAAQKAKRLQQLRYGGLIFLAVVLLAAFAFFRQSNKPQVDPLASLRASDPSADVAAALSDAQLEETLGISLQNIRGNPSAPVSIVEYGDFGCPSCRAWHNAGVMEQIESRFGDQVSFTFRHFPVITAQSPKAAEASQCAADQEKFWEFHDYMYERANGLSADQLKGYAADMGLDTAAFNDCLDSGKYQSYVASDYQAAISAGARGTPSFFLNGQPVSLVPEDMIAAIEVALGN